jgi:hypothetical protein
MRRGIYYVGLVPCQALIARTGGENYLIERPFERAREPDAKEISIRQTNDAWSMIETVAIVWVIRICFGIIEYDRARQKDRSW